MVFFLSQEVDGNTIYTDYQKVVVLNLSEMKNMILSLKYGHGFEPKTWWEYYIYWLLKSSCFKHFDDGKYSLFSGKKLMERWYLLGLFELSLILQGSENMVFCAVLTLSIISFSI